MDKPDSRPDEDPQSVEEDRRSLSVLMPDVYAELRRLARLYMARERPGGTLQATALVHEAYVKLKNEKAPRWRNRSHFCAIAAHAMRELLVEKARARGAAKRGGSRLRISLSEADAAVEAEGIDLLALHEALDRLADQDAGLARLVELRFFGGLTVEETATVLERSTATVKRGWSLARAWLRRELESARES